MRPNIRFNTILPPQRVYKYGVDVNIISMLYRIQAYIFRLTVLGNISKFISYECKCELFCLTGIIIWILKRGFMLSANQIFQHAKGGNDKSYNIASSSGCIIHTYVQQGKDMRLFVRNG